MKASVIITTYNQAPILKIILENLYKQSTNSMFEIILCIDGSVDSSYGIYKKFKSLSKKIKISFCWQQDKRFRAAASRNNGINLAKGEIIILIDGDMVPDKDFVDRHIRFHENNPKTLLTGSRLTIDDSKFLNYINKKISYSDLMLNIRNQSVLNDEELKFRKYWYEGNKPWMSVFSCNLSFPTDINARYSELFIGWGIEDWDFSYRMYKSGYNIHFSDKIIAYHVDYKPVISNAFRNNDHLQMVEFARNLMIFIDQYPDENLTDCAIALRNYQIDGDNISWAGDKNILLDQNEALKSVRKWLAKNKIYKKDEAFFIEYNYKNVLEINEVDVEKITKLEEYEERYDLIRITAKNISSAKMKRLMNKANAIKSNVKIYS